MKLYYSGDKKGSISYSIDNGNTFIETTLDDMKNGNVSIPNEADLSKIKVKSKNNIFSNIDVIGNITKVANDKFYAFVLNENISQEDLYSEQYHYWIEDFISISKDDRNKIYNASHLPIIYCTRPVIDNTSRLYVIHTFNEKGYNYNFEFNKDYDLEASIKNGERTIEEMNEYVQYVNRIFKRCSELDIQNPFRSNDLWYCFEKDKDKVYANTTRWINYPYSCYIARVIDIETNRNFTNCPELNGFPQKALEIKYLDDNEEGNTIKKYYKDYKMSVYSKISLNFDDAFFIDNGGKFNEDYYEDYSDKIIDISNIYLKKETLRFYRVKTYTENNKIYNIFYHFKDNDTSKSPDTSLTIRYNNIYNFIETFTVKEHPTETENFEQFSNEDFIELPSILVEYAKKPYISEQDRYTEQDFFNESLTKKYIFTKDENSLIHCNVEDCSEQDVLSTYDFGKTRKYILGCTRFSNY